MDRSDLLPLAVGVGNAAATAYLWLARLNRERPRVRAALVGVPEVRSAGLYGDGVWNAAVDLQLAVVNLSVLPNVAVRVQFWVGANGAWKDAGLAGTDAAAFNLPPQQAVFVRGTVVVPDLDRGGASDAEWDALKWPQALARAVGGPARLRVTVTALDDRQFTDEFDLPA